MRIGHVTTMFPVQENNPRAETRGNDPIECAPIPRMHDVRAGFRENAAELKDGIYAISRLLLEFVMANRLLNSVKEFPGIGEET